MSVETFIKANRLSAEQTERFMRGQEIKLDRLAAAAVWVMDNALISKTTIPTEHIAALGEAREMVARAKSKSRLLGDVISFPGRS